MLRLAMLLMVDMSMVLLVMLRMAMRVLVVMTMMLSLSLLLLSAMSFMPPGLVLSRRMIPAVRVSFLLPLLVSRGLVTSPPLISPLGTRISGRRNVSLGMLTVVRLMRRILGARRRLLRVRRLLRRERHALLS